MGSQCLRATVFLMLVGPALVAAQPVAVGPEFQVNTFTTGYQFSPAVASDAAGNFVVVWSSGSGYYTDQGADHSGLFGQRVDNTGARLGSEFPVNTDTTGPLSEPAVASDSAGNFVVVWSSGDQYYAGQDGSGSGVFGQRFDRNGAVLGSEFQVNTYTTGSQAEPAVASGTAGNFMVVWSSDYQGGSYHDVFAQRFDSSGARSGGEFQVNTYTTGYQGQPAVASDLAGNFVVVWSSGGQYQYSVDGPDGSGTGVFGQRFDSSGARLGSEFQVNTYTTGLQAQPAVASDPGGDFVVVWASGGQDGSGTGIFGQRFDSSGARLGSEFQVNTYTTGYQLSPKVQSGPRGDFLVVWSGAGQGQSAGVFGQLFDSAGGRLGSEFPVNTYILGVQAEPAVASDAVGNFVVAWSSGRHYPYGGSGQDGSYFGVFGQRYAATPSCDGVNVPVSVDCMSSGQRCDPPFSIPFSLDSASPVSISYRVGPRHCSAVLLHVLLDGAEVATSGWLGYPRATGGDASLPLTTGPLDLGTVEAGDHTLGIQAEGRTGGCNKGTLGTWGGSLCLPSTVHVDVPPEAINDEYSMPKGGRLDVAAPGVLANDLPGPSGLTAVLVRESVEAAKVDFRPDGSFSYTEETAPDFEGRTCLEYRAVDSQSRESNIARVRVTVGAGGNRPPLARDDFYGIPTGGAVLELQPLGVLANDDDPECDPLTAVLIASSPSIPAEQLNFREDGSLIYTPAPDFSGEAWIDYKARDALGEESNVARVTFVVGSPTPITCTGDERCLAGQPTDPLSRSLENQIRVYAPAVYLHPDENYWPDYVEDFVSKSCILFLEHRTKKTPYKVCPARPSGLGVAPNRAATYQFRGTYAIAYTAPAETHKDGFFIDLRDADSNRSGQAPQRKTSGLYDPKQTVPVYAQVGRLPQKACTAGPDPGTGCRADAECAPGNCADAYFITYWFFYAYNKKEFTFPVCSPTMPPVCTFVTAGDDHEGDWEGISIKFISTCGTVCPGGLRPAKIAYFEHGSDCTRYFNWDDRTTGKVNRTHPVVYSANGSHASYRAPGNYEICHFSRACVEGHGPGCDSASKGLRWSTWEDVVNLGIFDGPLNFDGLAKLPSGLTRQLLNATAPWYGFGGDYGDVRRTTTIAPTGSKKLLTTGPPGPGWRQPFPVCWGSQPPDHCD